MMRIALVVLVAALGLAACDTPAENTDPKKGHIHIGPGEWKSCDGTTLVYQLDRGGSVVPNSPECA